MVWACAWQVGGLGLGLADEPSQVRVSWVRRWASDLATGHPTAPTAGPHVPRRASASAHEARTAVDEMTYSVPTLVQQIRRDRGQLE